MDLKDDSHYIYSPNFPNLTEQNKAEVVQEAFKHVKRNSGTTIGNEIQIN